MIDYTKTKCSICHGEGLTPKIESGSKWVKRVGWEVCCTCKGVRFEGYNKPKYSSFMDEALHNKKEKQSKEKFWRRYGKGI